MSMYGAPQRGKGSMMLPANNNSSLSIVSPTTQTTIKLHEVQIPSDNVLSSIFKCPYNTRNEMLLSEATVFKILSSIRKSGRNTVPVLAVKHDDGRYEILSGMKRSYAVSISPGCNLVLHYALNSDVSDADKIELTKTFDEHEKPSFLDTALSLRDYVDSNDSESNVRELALIFGVSKSSVSDLLRISRLPFELFNLFPSAAHVGRNFLFSVAKLNLPNETILGKLDGLTPIRLDTSNVDIESEEIRLNDEVKKLNSVILDRLKAKPTGKNSNNETNSYVSPFRNLALANGVKAVEKGGGRVVLTLDKSFLDSELGKQLIKTITS